MEKAAYSTIDRMPKKSAISEYLAGIGRKGGKKKVPKGTAALTPEERAERGRQGAAKRWGEKQAGLAGGRGRKKKNG
jgi:hypothetical protein